MKKESVKVNFHYQGTELFEEHKLEDNADANFFTGVQLRCGGCSKKLTRKLNAKKRLPLGVSWTCDRCGRVNYGTP